MAIDCYHSSCTVGAWFLCFARNRLADTHTARDRRSLDSRLAVHRQETVEIATHSFLSTLPN